MTITREDVDAVILVAQVLFDNSNSSTFCGCYEGDLNDEYPEGVKYFLDTLRSILTEIAEGQQEES